MALGIDSAAHAGALEAPGPPIAVLAGGAEALPGAQAPRCYRRITAAARRVGDAAGLRRSWWAFPARNRIIAALVAATVVVEAQERSGSLITAEIAADLGRTSPPCPDP